jgi:hypothetical protein
MERMLRSEPVPKRTSVPDEILARDSRRWPRHAAAGRDHRADRRYSAARPVDRPWWSRGGVPAECDSLARERERPVHSTAVAVRLQGRRQLETNRELIATA